MKRSLLTRLVVFILPLVLAGCEEDVARQSLSELELERLDDGVDQIADFGGKIVILNVWATWCAPCRAEMPSLQKMSEELNPEYYAVLGLSIDETPFPVREYLREKDISFAQHIDRGGRKSRDVLRINDVPQTLVLDEDGTLIQRIRGAKEWQARDIRAQFPKTGMN